MLIKRSGIIVLFVSLVATVSFGSAQTALKDPYEILNKHITATGGIEKLKGERTQYFEGTLSLAGLSGPIKVWTRKPDFTRTEVDLKVLKITQAENSDGQWVLDSNGKLQLITKRDEAALKRKEVKRRMGEFEYLDPNSTVFKVASLGTDTANGRSCYVLQVTNTINDDAQTFYISTEKFLLERQISKEGEESNDSYFADYRDIGGMKVAFYSKQTQLRTGQEQEVTISKYESNPTIDMAIFEPPQEQEADFKFVNGTASENVPFKFRGNHIYIPVTVNCKERYWVLDTGAEATCLNTAFAKELGLTLEGNIKGGASNSTVDIQLTTLPPFSVKGIEFKEQKAAVFDMSPLNKLLDIQADGILGFDFLSRFVTKVDFAHELLSFYDPKSFQYFGDGTKLDVHIKGGDFVARATLDGVHSGTWLCDLGASSASLEGAYALKSGLLKRKGVESMGRGAGDAYLIRSIRCDSLNFAGFTLKNPRIHFPVEKIDTVSAADEIGNLGNTVFRNFVLYVDYANERMIVEPGDQFGFDFPEDRSGIQLMRTDDGGFEIWYVSAGTAGARAGFAVGDRLLAVNDIVVKDFDGISAIRELLSAKAGTKYKITIRRGDKQQDLNLTLAEMF